MPSGRKPLLIKKPSDILASEITSRTNYLNRRQFIKAGAIAGSSLIAPAALGAVVPEGRRAALAEIDTDALGLARRVETIEAALANLDHLTRGIDRLVMVGLATDFCVNYSAVDAARLGFGVTVLDFGIRWQNAVAILLTTQAIQFGAARVVGLPRFDPLSALITSLSLTLLLRTDTVWLAAAASAAARLPPAYRG